MIKIDRPIVVEGRYDKMRLSSIIDGVIIETGGFRIFKDKQLLEALRSLAQTTGIILLTDSDGAGFKIRSFIKSSLGKNARITNVYIPSIEGVEKRKEAPSAEGLLGVEGMSEQTLLDALDRAGVTCREVTAKSCFTTADLFEACLTGCDGSAERRRKLLQSLQLPQRLSNSAMLSMLNLLLTREEFEERLALLGLKQEKTPL